jgi:hypothetical protein
MEFENEMHGGAKPINRSGSISRFELVCNMIQSSTRIECISYSSLKGFVFSIEGTPQFVSLTPQLFSNKKRNLKLGKIILKFTLLTEGDKNEKLPEFEMDFKEVEDKDENKQIIKETDLKKDFVEESFTQLDIFTRSFQIGTLSICPSILASTVLKNTEANIFLDFIESKIDGSADIKKEVIKYMKEQLKTYSLGIIAMEYAEKFVLLNDFYKLYFGKPDVPGKNNEIITSVKGSPEEKEFLTGVDNIILSHRIALVLSNMLLLLFEFFYLHYDLHLNNVFVLDYTPSSSCDNFLDLLNPNVERTILMSCSRMIDFGRVYKIETTIKDTTKQKEDTTKQKESKLFVSNEEVENLKERTLFSNYDKFIELITKDSFDFNNKDNFGEASTFIEGFLKFMFDKDAEINNNNKRPQCFGIFYLGGLAEKTTEGYKLRLNQSKNRDYIFFLIIKYFRTIYKKPRMSEPRNGKKKPPRFQYFKDPEANNFKQIFNERDEDKILKEEGYTEHSLPGIFLNIGLDMLEKKGVTSEKIKIENTKLTISETKIDKSLLENMNKVIEQLGGTIEFTI